MNLSSKKGANEKIRGCYTSLWLCPSGSPPNPWQGSCPVAGRRPERVVVPRISPTAPDAGQEANPVCSQWVGEEGVEPPA